MLKKQWIAVAAILVAFVAIVLVSQRIQNAELPTTQPDEEGASTPASFDLTAFETPDDLIAELRSRLPPGTTKESVDVLLVKTAGGSVEANPDTPGVYHYKRSFFAPAIQEDWLWNITVKYTGVGLVDQIWVNGSAVHRDRPFTDGQIE